MYKSGITRIFLSIKIWSAAGVVGPLAASATIFACVQSATHITRVQPAGRYILLLIDWFSWLSISDSHLDTSSVLFGNYFLYGSGYKYITWFVHKILALVWFGPREANDGAVFYAILLQFLKYK